MGIIEEIAKMSNANPFVSAPSSEADYLQRAIEKQVAAQRAQANKSVGNAGAGSGTTSALQQLQMNLQDQLNNLPDFSTPIEQLRAQATSQANAQYNPLMDALRTQMSQTKTRAGRNEKSAKDMYGSLAKDLASQIPGITNEMKQAQNDTSQRYSQAQSDMQGDYSKQAADQAAVLKQLGISGAAPETQAAEQNDQTYFKNQQGLDKQQALDALQQQQGSATTYQQNISDSSRLAGTNAAQDIATQLSDYLTQAGSQLGTLSAQRSSSIESLLSQLQGADQTNANTQRQSEIDNLMALGNYNLSSQKAQDAQSKASGDNSIFSGTSGPKGASNYLAEKYGTDQSGTASQIMGLISKTMKDPSVIEGKHATGTDQYGKTSYTSNSDAYIEDILKHQMEKAGGYGSSDINSAINALLAYLGKLR